MKLSKAIEILADLELSDVLDLEPDEKEALKLGIEAIRIVDHLGKAADIYLLSPRPGETEETNNASL